MPSSSHSFVVAICFGIAACETPAAVAPAPCPPLPPPAPVTAVVTPAPATLPAPTAAERPAAAPLDKNLPRPEFAAKSAPLPGFMKGINLGNCFDAPSEGAWGTVISEKHFEMAEAAGLDHVRLPARFTTPERSAVAPTIPTIASRLPASTSASMTRRTSPA